MQHKLKDWIQKHHQILTYLAFGFLTTAVNYAVYLPLYNFTSFPAAVSNGIAWLAAVLFAYITNKRYVFQSQNWAQVTLITEFLRFMGCRVISGVIETGIIFVCVDLLGIDGNLIKILTGILVIILNYIGSKLLVFRKDNLS